MVRDKENNGGLARRALKKPRTPLAAAFSGSTKLEGAYGSIVWYLYSNREAGQVHLKNAAFTVHRVVGVTAHRAAARTFANWLPDDWRPLSLLDRYIVVVTAEGLYLRTSA